MMSRTMWIAVGVLIGASSAGAGLFEAGAQQRQREGGGAVVQRDDKTAGTRAQPPALKTQEPTAQPPAAQPSVPVRPTVEKDPRENEAAYQQAKRLMQAVDAILQDAAGNRSEAKKLPSKDDFLVSPLWTETREDRERKVRDLLDAALGIVSDVPVVELQKRIEHRRKTIRELEDRIVKLKEKQLTAPQDAFLPGVLTDTVDSLAKDIDDASKRIISNRSDIAAAKSEVQQAIAKSGIKMSNEQVDLLLDGVLSGDLVRLVAVFNSAKLIDMQLGRLMTAAGENVNAARKYFAMHATLFALLVHAQNVLIAKIDTNYLPKLDAIANDIASAKIKTHELLKVENRPDQRRALEANRDSQRLAEDAAKKYRRYLEQQRDQIAKARVRAEHDLRIADNTYETVEASFQLRNLMQDAASSFEAIQKLEAPTFEQIFRNEELRREFENLTRKLGSPTS